MRSFSTLFFLAALAVASLEAKKVPWNNLSVKWSLGGLLSHTLGSAFYDLPVTQSDAQKQSWVQARQETLTSLWCFPSDPRVCTLYDQQGSIAGLQVCYPVEDLKGNPYDWTKHQLFHADNVFGKAVACGRFYLVPQDVLQSGGRKTFDEIGTGLWLQDGDHLTNIPQDATKLESQGWSKESCISTMGRHYYYNITNTMSCTDFEPFFILSDDSNNWTHGIGFQTFGKKSKQSRDWEETVPGLAVKPTIPNTPDCLPQWADQYGVLSLHVYFINRPYLYFCPLSL